MILTEDIFDTFSDILKHDTNRLILIDDFVIVDATMLVNSQQVTFNGFRYEQEYFHEPASHNKRLSILSGEITVQLDTLVYNIGDDIARVQIWQTIWEDATESIIWPLENP